MNSRQKKPILVLGVGNSVQQDDGIGVHVVDALADYDLPEIVELFDGGTAGLDLINIVDGRKHLIVIDAVKWDSPPGTVFRFTPEDITDEVSQLHSLHQVGLLETIRMAHFLQAAPEKTVIIGVQPKVIDWGLELTDEVKAVVPKVIDQVMKEINLSVTELNSQVLMEETSERK